MLAVNPRIIASATNSFTLRWNANSGEESWVYADGELIVGPVISSDTVREVSIPLSKLDTAQVEIHNVVAGSAVPKSTWAKRGSRPVLKWAPLTLAERIRIHHTDETIGTEKKIYDKKAKDERAALKSPVRMVGRGGRWHLIRIETVRAEGTESTRNPWAYRSREPNQERNLSIVEGSTLNLFDITLEA